MDNHTIFNMTVGELAEGRALAFIDAAIFAISLALYSWFAPKVGSRTFFARRSLRTRLAIGLTGLAIITTAGAFRGVGVYYLVIFTLISSLLLVRFVLSDLLSVGVLNAFATTTVGIRPEQSLRMTHKQLAFLGIGGKKLSDLPEFENAMKRIATAGGAARFLLSSPENPALEQLAVQNQKSDSSYKSRVRESIREIDHKARASGVKFEIKIYKLDHALALPHFRLMFIDDRFCIFSHLVWNSAEGMDNPQLLLRKETRRQSNSLYLGYEKYFDDIWNSPDAQTVDKALLDSWPT